MGEREEVIIDNRNEGLKSYDLAYFLNELFPGIDARIASSKRYSRIIRCNYTPNDFNPATIHGVMGKMTNSCVCCWS